MPLVLLLLRPGGNFSVSIMPYFPFDRELFSWFFSWLVPALAYSQQGQNFLTMGVQLTNVANFRLLFFYGSKKMDSICNGPILSIT